MTDHPETEFSVEYYKQNRLPYSVGLGCPACMNVSMSVAFAANPTIRTGSSSWMQLETTDGALTDPHLIVQCNSCEFFWEMEVAHP